MFNDAHFYSLQLPITHFTGTNDIPSSTRASSIDVTSRNTNKGDQRSGNDAIGD